MTFDLRNPFSDYGNIIGGERFIGRKEGLRILESRVVRPQEPGNLAVIGEPRIGKSSLVYKAIVERKEELVARKLLPIWINLGTYDQATVFLRSLATTCYEELEELGWVTSKIDNAFERTLHDKLSWNETYVRIQRFFQRVRQEKIRVIFILDEFDHARFLFKDDTSGFQGLRELSYRPEWRVTFVTTSRRGIRDIEIQARAISTFDGIFHKHYLSMFNETDLEEYFSRMMEIGLPLTSQTKSRVDYYCGGHPYLLEMLGYELVELFREKQQVNADFAAKRIETSFIDQYDRIIDLLKEDGNLGKLLQILFGPVVDVKQTEVDELVRYGFVKLTDQELYVAFSEHFQLYLRLIEREVDLWPLWSETEKVLRQLIATEMVEKFGSDWIVKLEKARPNLTIVFEKARKAQLSEEVSFGSRASRNLIDFTYPQDLFAIIFFDWKDTFQQIFGNDKNYWQQCANLLAKIRNPLAHNRNHVLYDADVRKAEGYCKEILTLVRQKGSTYINR